MLFRSLDLRTGSTQEEPTQEERADANGGQADEEEDLSDGDLGARELSDGDLSEAGNEDPVGTAAEFKFVGTMNKFFIDNAMEKMVRGDMHGGETDDEPGKPPKGDTGDLAKPPQPGTKQAPETKIDKVEPKDVTGNDTVEVFGNGFGQAATGVEKNMGLGAQAPTQAPTQAPAQAPAQNPNPGMAQGPAQNLNPGMAQNLTNSVPAAPVGEEKKTASEDSTEKTSEKH